MPQPERNEFKEWREHPVTEWVFEQIELMIQEYADSLGAGASYSVDSVEKTALKTAEAVGFIDGLKSLYKLELR